MFNFDIYANDRHPYLKKVTKAFSDHFVAEGNILDPLHPDIIFVFGGDGTLLSAIRRKWTKKAPFMLINDGTLGFYKEYDLNELDMLYKEFDFSSLTIEKHRFIQIEDSYGHKSKACNEFVLASSIQTMAFNIYMNKSYFMEVRGSGVCVASPFGSTGYNHSLGGALLAEDSGMALSLLAPIRNRVFHPLISSLVAEDKDTIGIEIVNDVNFELAGDMKILSDLQGKTFTISKSQACFSLAHSRDFSFYKRMRKAFLE